MSGKINRAIVLLLIGIVWPLRAAETGSCADPEAGKVVIDPQLESSFFSSKEGSYPWNVVEHDDGTLENTLGGKVDKTKVKKVEHTSNSISTHQGEHVMNFCDAEWDGDKLILTVSGGMPAYASSLTLTIEGERFNCSFKAVYPGGRDTLQWRITKKQMKIKSDPAKEERLYGWISVEFEEGRMENGKMVWHPYKIEGYLKPVLPRKFELASLL